MNKKDEDVLVIKENIVVSFCKDHKKIVITLLVLLVLILIGLICLFNIDNFKYCSSDKVVKKYSNSYVKLDEKDYCDTLYEGIVNNVMGSKDECYRLAKKTFTDDNMKKYESIKITKRKELVDKEFEDFLNTCEHDYKIDSGKIKKVIAYNVEFKTKENNIKSIIYVGKIDGKWYVLAQDNIKE